jgi:hypothetical protein
MQDSIVAAKHDVRVAAGALAVKPGDPLPDTFAQVVASPDAVDHRYFQTFYEKIAAAAAQHASAERLRVVVIGHTHEAAMILCKPPDGARPLLFIDSGAWIERCAYTLESGEHVVEPSAQLAVIHGNDARLYQIRAGA